MMTSQPKTSSYTKLFVPGIIGNILEWYDFSLYGYFAPVIARLFFPTSNQLLSLLSTFGVFAIGFLMRPLGAIIFGYFGDKIGRKKTLAFAVILMAIPTTLIGLLPTHQEIGITAGVLLTLCRLLQGLAVGGEFSGSIVYITEHAPNDRRGMYGSWAMFSAFTGLLIGSGVSALASLLSPHALNTWGWRVPFLMGLILGFVGLYLRLHMPETPNFLSIKNKHEILNNPTTRAFKSFIFPMILMMGLVFLPAMSFYLLFVYLSSYMTDFLHVPMRVALTVNTISMIGIIIIMPWIGLLSDKIGRKPVLYSGALGFIILSYPLFLLLQHATFISILFAQTCFALLVCLTYASIPATLVELVPTAIRYTAMSFPYNLSNAIFGGTAPLVATYIISKTNNPLSPCFYLIFAGIVMLCCVFILKESYDKPLPP